MQGAKKKVRSVSYAKWGYVFIAPFFIVFALFQLYPLVSTIYYSFFEYFFKQGGLIQVGPKFVGWTNYLYVFSKDLPRYFGNTIIMWLMGFIPQIFFSLLLAAWFTDNRLKLKCQGFFKTIIYMPNLIMASAFAMLFFALFSDNGPVNAVLGVFGLGPFNMLNTSGAVVLGMVYNYVPYMILPLYTSMTKIDQSLVEAAQDLGANTTKTLLRVLIPMSVPGISTGITMVFVPAVSTFVISRMLGGGTELLLGDLIERQFLGGAYNPQLGAAISLVMMVIVLVCMLVMNRFGEGEEQAVIL